VSDGVWGLGVVFSVLLEVVLVCEIFFGIFVFWVVVLSIWEIVCGDNDMI